MQMAVDEEHQHAASEDDDWDDENAGNAGLAKAKAAAKGKAKAKPKARCGAKAKAKSQADKGAKSQRQPLGSCICPGCSFPKYPGSRFCSTGEHKRAYDNMMYQRRSRKDVTEAQKAAFDQEMKDDGFAGKAVLAFSKDNPPEMRRKGLVDFTKFVRVYGERCGSKSVKGRVPMTEKAFYKHCENVLGLTEEEAKEAWEEYQADPLTEKDNEGFRGSERLWLPVSEVRSKEREHYVDNQVQEGSGDIKAPSAEDRKMLKD